MHAYRGFLIWMFRGWYQDLTFWGLVIGVIAAAVSVSSGTSTLTLGMFILSLSLVLFDLVRSFLRFQYSLYEMEKDRVVRALDGTSQER